MSIFNRFRIQNKKTVCSTLDLRVFNAAFWSFAGAASQKGLLLATSFICMRILGKTDYGKMSIVRSTIALFILFGAVGMGSTATKYVAEFRDKDKRTLKEIYNIVFMIGLGCGCIAMVLVMCFSGYIASYVKDSGLVHCIQIGAILLFFSILTSIQTGILSGLEKFKEIAVISAIGGVVEFLCIVLGSYFLSVAGALIGYTAGFISLTMMNQYCIRKSLYKNEFVFSFSCIDWQKVKKLLLFSIPLLGSSLMVTPVMWYSQALLTRKADFAELGIYSAADQWRMVLLFVPSAMSRIILPMLSNFGGNNDEKSYLKILKMNLLINFSATFIMLALYACIIPVVLKLYQLPNSCYLVFLILAASTIFSALGTVFGQAITSKGKTWIGFCFNFGWGIMVLAFSYYFLNKGFGALSLSLAMLLSYFLHMIFQWSYFIKIFIKEFKRNHENNIGIKRLR